MSLELIPRDGVDICMGVTVCLPPICYRTKELVRGKKKPSHDPCTGQS
jgi:hypothetical protein